MKETKRKKSTVRHTRAVQNDRGKRPLVSPPEGDVEQRLKEIVLPAARKVQEETFRHPGLRARKLPLVVMVAFVLSLIWRHTGNISQGARLLNSEGLLWTGVVTVTQQALCLRMGSLCSRLFLEVLMALLPTLHSRSMERQRPLPPELQWARERYTRISICDGSTLDALSRKIGLLRGTPTHPLAGRMTALLDACSRLPWCVWYEPNPKAHDQRFWPLIIEALPAGALLIFDLGYMSLKAFLKLTASGITWITRAKSNLSYKVQSTILRSGKVRDQLIRVGEGAETQLVRLIEVFHQGTWRRYLTNELDPKRLPTEYVVALYWQRWRIEDAYFIVKRLLGLAYFYTGSQNGVCMQLWTTWILHAILIDLSDSVAEALDQPLAAISIQMVYQSLYFYQQAYDRGEANDLVTYLAANARWLGIIKRRSKKPSLALLRATLTSGPGP
jgi:hypothetical protein